MRFADRADAGRRLARALVDYRDRDPVVLALPRGGLPVAAEIASALAAPLDVVLVRKIGVPWQPELAMGALVEGDDPIVARNEAVISAAGIDERAFETARNARAPNSKTRGGGFSAIGRARDRRPRRHPRRRRRRHRRDRARRAAIDPPPRRENADARRSRRLGEALAALKREVDDLVCLEAPARFGAVSAFYADFRQVEDEEAVAILARFSPAARVRRRRRSTDVR